MSGFFWFDPFGSAPAEATVSGSAGGFISWGGRPGWPFEWPRSDGFIPLITGRRYPMPFFQACTAVDPDAPPEDEPVTLTVTRKVVFRALTPEADHDR